MALTLEQHALREAGEMLRLLEWSDVKPTEIVDGIQQYGEWCPYCQIERSAGHSTINCRLAGTIRTVRAALDGEA